jgi:hypothetical protein
MPTRASRSLLDTLATRFAAHTERHRDIDWNAVEARIMKSAAGLRTLAAMEETGGEPDVIDEDNATGGFVFCDCSAETPVGRRSLCFDAAALAARKENKPAGSALEMAASMGIELLAESQYRALQELGEFDRKTSSWIATPASVRALGGALFCDRRYGRVFVYHNGVQSYYAVRGFRGRVVI